MTTRLYLAYGSNLSKANMRSRCSGARAVGKVRLRDVRLIFRGVADVVPALGSSLVCGLWKITRDDERCLDRFEGVGGGHYEKRYARIDRTGERAMLYVMRDSGVMPPTSWYVDTIRRGYRDFGIDQSQLDEAIAEAWGHKLPTDYTRARRQRQLAQGGSRATLYRLDGEPRRVMLRHRCPDCGTVEHVAQARHSRDVCSICEAEREKFRLKRARKKEVLQ